MWFPNQGTWGPELAKLGEMRISKDKYTNTSAKEYLDQVIADDTVRRQLNPARRLGNIDDIHRDGIICQKISKELGNMDIKPIKSVKYENINAELLRISPDIDINEKS